MRVFALVFLSACDPVLVSLEGPEGLDVEGLSVGPLSVDPVSSPVTGDLTVTGRVAGADGPIRNLTVRGVVATSTSLNFSSWEVELSHDDLLSWADDDGALTLCASVDPVYDVAVPADACIDVRVAEPPSDDGDDSGDDGGSDAAPT